LRLLREYPFLASLPRYDDSSTTKSTLPPLLFDSFPDDGDDDDEDPECPSTRNFPTADPYPSYATRTSPTFAISRPLLPGGMACESCTCSPVSGRTRNIRTLRGGLRGSASPPLPPVRDVVALSPEEASVDVSEGRDRPPRRVRRDRGVLAVYKRKQRRFDVQNLPGAEHAHPPQAARAVLGEVRRVRRPRDDADAPMANEVSQRHLYLGEYP
jgi:hypothetical protein